MAGDWIKLTHTTPDKPEVFEMADRLGIDPDAVVGKLIRVWIWADQQTRDGNAPSVTRALLDRLSAVHGFADAMEAAGWLETTEGGVRFVNFDRHNGSPSKSRALGKQRTKRHREVKRDGNAPSVTAPLQKRYQRREEKSIQEPPIVPLGDSETSGKKFTRPTTADVLEYCQERGLSIDAERFVDHYTANGWRIGKTPMKDWRAAVRNWARERKQRDGSTNDHDDYQALRD